MESMRVRLVFKDDYILSEAQKSEGLNRSWVLLNINQQKTISEVVSHLVHAFQLQHSCPHGLLLSIDGYVLPPFESACILKDKDIIRVKKRAITLSIEGNNVSNSVQKLKALDKQPINNGILLLANEKFEKEKGGYESDEPEEKDEDEGQKLLKGLEGTSGGKDISKKRKRKAVEECQLSKKKKRCAGTPVNVANDVPTEKSLPLIESTSIQDKNVENKEDAERSEKLKQNGEKIKGETLAATEIKKISRSTRRKYAKRKFKKEMAKLQKENEAQESGGIQKKKKDRRKAKRKEMDYQSQRQHSLRKDRAELERNDMDGQPKGLLHWRQLPGSDASKTPKNYEQQIQTTDSYEHPNQNGEEHGQPMQNGEVHEQTNQNANKPELSDQLNKEAEVVPIVIRPGHIRFEPLEEERAVEQIQAPAETLRWNGISSKRKGQKWGREKPTYSPQNNNKVLNRDFSEISSKKEEKLSDEGIDFDKLPLLADVPKEGDLIAYRILELSTSWTPELSPYRVGKVSWVNTESKRIMLMPVPKYPVLFNNLEEDESATQPDNSLYKEDGSLEIDLSSLVDVRIVKGGSAGPRCASPSCLNEGPVGNKSAAEPELPSSDKKQIHAPTPEHGELNHGEQAQLPSKDNGVSIWDQITETLNAKKAQLLQENDEGQQSSGKKSWSYKALRGSALGPTMAFLRSKNDI